MAEINCGFEDSQDYSGSELLVQLGPTVSVYVGFDIRFWQGEALAPDLPTHLMSALVDTGASSSCIDSELAEELGLPVIDEDTVGGVGGVIDVNLYWAQLFVPGLATGFSGPMAGVHLRAGQQPHSVLIGRDLLQRFTMVYDGKTGAVIISDGGGSAGQE